MALVLLNVTIALFANLSYPKGLLHNLTNLVWIWLIYRIILTLLYARYGIEGVRPYRKRIVTPLFVFLFVCHPRRSDHKLGRYFLYLG